MINTVVISERANNDLNRVPKFILQKLNLWADLVRIDGLELTRKIPGYPNELLKGNRWRPLDRANKEHSPQSFAVAHFSYPMMKDCPFFNRFLGAIREVVSDRSDVQWYAVDCINPL